jgi:hypothetical protein
MKYLSCLFKLFVTFLLTDGNVLLHNFYFLPDIVRVMKSRKMKVVEHVVHMGKMRNAYRVLVGNPGVKSLLGRHRHK